MRSAPAVVAAVLLLAGCAAPEATPTPEILYPGGPDGSTATATPTSEPVSAADIEFVQSMIAHHAQAVALSGLAETRSADPKVTEVAERIAQTQQAELDAMVVWLTQLGLEPDPHGHDASLMPGGISATVMARAESAAGIQFDRIFVPTMIAHHEGALQMAQERLNSGGESAITRLAQSIISGQQLEIEYLQELAATLEG